MLLELEGLNYKERLGLFSLKHRRMRGDLIEVCKIMRGIDQVNSQGIFPRVGMGVLNPRGHRFKVRVGRFDLICHSISIVKSIVSCAL